MLADARLRDEVATCPSCRVELSRASACRNLAVEKAVSELPAPCSSCGKEFARAVLQRHQDELCDERYRLSHVLYIMPLENPSTNKPIVTIQEF